MDGTGKGGIALAVTHGVRTPQEAWEISRVDETWQAEQWGEDEEAVEIAALKRADFLRAAEIWRLLST